MVPPWKELFRNDPERHHSFRDAEEEYEGLKVSYEGLACETVIVPKMSVEQRADYIEAGLIVD